MADRTEPCAEPVSLQRLPTTAFATSSTKLEEYESLHEDAGVFVIVPGHPRVNGEVVLQRQARFEQVQKPGT